METLKDIRLNDKEIQQIVSCLKDKLFKYEQIALQLSEGNGANKDLKECLSKSKELIYLIGKLENNLKD